MIQLLLVTELLWTIIFYEIFRFAQRIIDVFMPKQNWSIMLVWIPSVWWLGSPLCFVDTGRRFFEELDRDGDGQVTLEDLEIAMRKRRLPRRYAKDFLRRTRSHLFSKSIGWRQFLTLMEQKEPTILRAYTTLCLSKSGTLQKNQILTSLKSAGLPASEDNACAMMRYLNADTGGSISYTHFRNFMLLLPSERLQDDPRYAKDY